MGASFNPRLMLPPLSDQQEENLMIKTEKSTQESTNAGFLPRGLPVSLLASSDKRGLERSTGGFLAYI